MTAQRLIERQAASGVLSEDQIEATVAEVAAVARAGRASGCW